jgi:hypothetical protein
MIRGRLAAGIVLVVALALPLSACAGKVRMSSAKMCRANGGTYNASAQTCSYTQSTMSAKQSCEMHGGYYDPAAQMCEVGME